MTDKPRHAPITQFPVIDDVLLIGGMPVGQLARQVGQTPFFAYDREVMNARVHTLRESLPDDLSIHYAVKSNPMPALVAHMAGLVDGLDIASLGEMRVALDAGTAVADISFAGPGKSESELRSAIAAGITLNVESEGELERAVRIGDQLGIAPRVALRVNPDFELKSSGMKMGGGPKPFGIDAERIPRLLNELVGMQAIFRGFHIFSGSQNLRSESLVEAQTATFELAGRLLDGSPLAAEMLNIGGGFGIPYFPGDRPLDLAPVADNLAHQLDGWRARSGDCEVILELGRFLVGEAGIYVCEVIDRKVSRGLTYLVTNGGLHHHLAASGNFGQVIRKNYPLVKPSQVSGGEREVVSVVGPLCTPLDLLGDRVELAHAEPGDLIAVLQSGAYGYTASPHGFLGHPVPLEVLV